jgi:hypothetical protein
MNAARFTTSTQDLARLVSGKMEGNGMKLAVRLVALLFLLVPATARAECAWVLWVRDFSTLGPPVFEPQESYTSKKECERDRTRAQENAKKAGRTREFYHCFPDTIDPRGPKVTQ